MKKYKIGLIGCGNMGEALVRSWLPLLKKSQITFFEPDLKRRKKIVQSLGIKASLSNQDLIRDSASILLAIKPQSFSLVAGDVRTNVSNELIISIMAGVDTEKISQFFPKAPIIRVMPNLGVMVGEGASALFSTRLVKPIQKKWGYQLFSQGGQAVHVTKEEELDMVTALSGSGPAFVFVFLKSLIEGAKALGLSEKLAKTLALQTLKGSLKVAGESKDDLNTLIQKVASKGGTTEAGLNVLKEKDFQSILELTLQKACERAKELRCIS